MITINNLIVDSIYNNYEYGYISGIDLDDSSVTANNIIVTNNHQDYPGVIVQYANTASDSPGGNLNLSNFLMYNNTSTDNTQPMAIFINRYDPSYLNNMTIANNTSSSRVLRLNGDFTMRNSILYNPQAGSEMHLWDLFAGDPNPIYSNVDIDYCLIRNGESEIDGADHPQNSLTWGNHNIDTNPLFRGDVEGDIPVGDPRWLQLTPNSPCVNAGTPDTLGMNLPALDITGNPRVWDNIIDMGAHEYNPTVDNTENIQPALSNQIVVSHFPNPVTPNGKNSNVAFIEFSLQKKPIDKPTLEIFNIKGQKIRSIKITQSFSQLVRSAGLSSEEKQSGEYYSQVWDCKDNNRKQVASGIYFYKVSSGGDSAIGKMMVIK
ncbi:MAG: choice-of-anchor Q domain-containing protein [Candidatus Zophobacter franzmannii]|nr:choice-of-anchor Q domain-containing protein [Candidatus Zophobacter franzmannii]